MCKQTRVVVVVAPRRATFVADKTPKGHRLLTP